MIEKFRDYYTGFNFEDVLIVPQFSDIKSRKDCDVSTKWADHPFICANMDTLSGQEMVNFMLDTNGIAILHRYMTPKDMEQIAWDIEAQYCGNNLFLSVGTLDNDKQRIKNILESTDERVGVCIDIAHGFSMNMLKTLNYIRKKSNRTIIAGNVATKDAAKNLFDNGANIVKVGIGPGSVCLTRNKTGVGFPQLKAIMECAEEGPIIADGGYKSIGDMCKALAVSPNVIGVMTGSFFAGTDMTPGWLSHSMMEYRGMASKEAQLKFKGKYANEEGTATLVPAKDKGSTAKVLQEMIEGLQSSMSYVGAKNLTEFAEKSQFIINGGW